MKDQHEQNTNNDIRLGRENQTRKRLIAWDYFGQCLEN